VNFGAVPARLLALLPILALASACSGASPAPGAARVTIGLAGDPIPETSFGFNLIWPGGAQGVWDAAGHRVRPAFADAARAIGVRCLRHPGGTLSHLYHFDRAIGPLAERQPIANAFTKESEVAAFGTDEFLAFCRDVGAEPLIVVAWAEGSPQEAAAWVAYLNARESDSQPIGRDAAGRDWGTAGDWAARRVRNGRRDPWGVRLFEVGNETDMKRFGCRASAYAARFRDYADRMRAVDPSIRLLAVGHRDAAGAGDADAAAAADGSPPLPWNETLLRECGDRIDLLAVHYYGPESEPDDERLVAAPGALFGEIGKIRDLARRIVPGRAIDVAITETNAGFHSTASSWSADNSSPRAALFVAATWLEALDAHVSPFVVHTLCVEPVADPALEGWRHFGVLVRDGERVAPSPVGRVLGRLSGAFAGARRCDVRAPDGLVGAAALRADGSLSVALLARSPSAPRCVEIAFADGKPRRLVRHVRFDRAGELDVAPSSSAALELESASLHVLEWTP
jgi:alpha-L-arabinofuranosidase-like protein